MMADPFSFLVNDVLPFLMRGAAYTLEIALLSLALGFLVGLPLALIRVFGPRYLAWIVEAYVSIVRGTPLLVQLFIVYFGLPSVGIIFDRWQAGLIAIGLNSAAYQSEYFRGAIQSVSSGQIMAAEALGFNRLGAITNVVLPQALRFALPAWSNEGTYLIKGSSVVFIIGSIDLTASGKILSGIFFRPFEIYFAVSIIYIVMVFAFSKIASLLVKKYRIPGYQMR